MTPDPPPPSDWSEPTLSRPVETEDETAEDQPAGGTEPVFTSVPFTPQPLARASSPLYETGTVPSWHPALIERAADVAVATMPIPLRVLDVGSGAGDLLAELVVRVPYAEAYVGVDPDAEAVAAAAAGRPDPHISFVRAAAEALPFPDASFDLVVALASFAYWADQAAGAAELARVVSDKGAVVVVEPAKSGSRQRNRARSVKEISQVLRGAGLRLERVERVRRSWIVGSAARAFIAFR
jgi:ubiquinone/menaquinone biosynthesis C-methylase UbiE